jgi:hypothetical protein
MEIFGQPRNLVIHFLLAATSSHRLGLVKSWVVMRNGIRRPCGSGCQVTAVLISQALATHEVGSTAIVDVLKQANAEIRQRSPT